MTSHTIKVLVNCDNKIGPLPAIWRSFGYDEFNWTYTRRGCEIFDEISQLSSKPYYIRCHHMLTNGNGLSVPTMGSGNVCTLDKNGELSLDFTLIDRFLDTLLQNNCKPIVELGFMPDALSNAPGHKPTYDYSDPGLWKYPPRDYRKWQWLVFEVVKHCVAQYGEAEVGAWYWEVWNEPDNPGFFKGSIKDYCKMYDHAVAGATRAFESVRIGGPALARDPKFLEKFLKHCSKGRNYATRGRGTRLDFISLHAKGNGWPIKGSRFEQPSLKKIESHLESYFAVLALYPACKDLDILLDECDMAVATNYGVYDFPELLFNNTEYYPVFLIRMAKRILDLIPAHDVGIKLFTTWAFYFEGKRLFEGNRALFTNENIRKPVFNAFVALEKLGDTRLRLDVESPHFSGEDSPPIDGLAARDRDAVTVMVWNFDEAQQSGEDIEIRIELEKLPFESESVTLERFQIDADHSNAHSTWQKLGAPPLPSAEQVNEIKEAGNLELVERVSQASVTEGRLSWSMTLPSPAVALIRVLRE